MFPAGLFAEVRVEDLVCWNSGISYALLSSQHPDDHIWHAVLRLLKANFILVAQPANSLSDTFLGLDLFCKLLESFQPVLNVTDGSLDVGGLFNADRHLFDTLHGSVSQVFYLEIQCCDIRAALQHWKLETVKETSHKKK